MSEKYVRYCIHCGAPLLEGQTVCPSCNKKVEEKENLFVDYLIKHTKDKFKEDSEDKVYEVIINFLKSHLYGSLVTVTLITTVVTGVAKLASRENIQQMNQRPVSVSEVIVASDISSLSTEVQSLNIEEPSLVTEETSTLPNENIYSFDTQLELMRDQRALWEYFDEFAFEPFYHIYDLDQDGLLEITTLLTQGSGYFTYMKSYEVNEDMTGLVEVDTSVFADGEAFDAFYIRASENDYENPNPPLTGYYDPETQVYHYLVEDVWYDGVESSGFELLDLTMRSNTYQANVIGNYTYSRLDDGSEYETYELNGVNYDTTDAFSDAVEAYYADMIPFTHIAPTLYQFYIDDEVGIFNSTANLYHLTFNQDTE